MPSRATKFRFHSLRPSQEKTPRATSPTAVTVAMKMHLVDPSPGVPALRLGHPPADIIEQGLEIELLVDSQEKKQQGEDHPEDRAGQPPLPAGPGGRQPRPLHRARVAAA